MSHRLLVNSPYLFLIYQNQNIKHLIAHLSTIIPTKNRRHFIEMTLSYEQIGSICRTCLKENANGMFSIYDEIEHFEGTKNEKIVIQQLIEDVAAFKVILPIANEREEFNKKPLRLKLWKMTSTFQH